MKLPSLAIFSLLLFSFSGDLPAALVITMRESPAGLAVNVEGSILAPRESTLQMLQSNAPLSFGGSNGAVGPSDQTLGSPTSATYATQQLISGTSSHTIVSFSQLAANGVTTQIDPDGVSNGLSGVYNVTVSQNGIRLRLPGGYILGSQIADSGVFPGETFQTAGLAIDESVTVTFLVDDAGTRDSITFRTTSVPEPSSILLAALAAAVVSFARRR